MTTLGVFDLIGNVREWCWNETGDGARCTSGAAWTDAPYHAGWIIPKSPWNRDSTHGFRLVRTFDNDEKLARLRQPEEPLVRRDFRKEEPVSDAEFMIYRRMYAYDSLPLNAEVVAVDTSEHWTRERVAFDLPSGERGAALLYIPTNIKLPFETVIYWPGSGALAGCGKTPSTGADLGFGGRFPLKVKRNFVSDRFPVVRKSLAGVPFATEHQVGHSKGLIRTRL
jgi:hypothetical protein